MYYTGGTECLSHTPDYIKVRYCGHGATCYSTTHWTLCEVNCTRLKQSEILAEFSNHPLPTPNLLELYLPLPTLNLLELYHHPPSLLDCPEWANGVCKYTVLQLYFCWATLTGRAWYLFYVNQNRTETERQRFACCSTIDNIASCGAILSMVHPITWYVWYLTPDS